jgi:hypothetical protein
MGAHRTLWAARRVALVVVLCVVTIGASARAEGADAWTAIEIGGQVSQRGPDGGWQPVVRGSTLADGARLRIGADGKLVLSRRKDTITASPSSEFQLPPDASVASGFSILQTLGTLLFRVEHTPGRRFEVDAPYLAAVVKGTVFTVSARDTGDSVHVAEGAVEVTTRAAHEVAVIRPGQTAAVTSSGGGLSITGGQNPVQEPRRREAKDPAAEAKGSTSVDAGDKAGEPRHSLRSDRGAIEITRTLGEEHLDIAALSKGLLDGGGEGSTRKLLANAAPAEHGAAVRDAGGNPNAAGGNPNAAGGNPNAAGGNPNAAGGNPNAAGGNPNPAGGNPNAAGGNANAAAQAAAGKANGHAKH